MCHSLPQEEVWTVYNLLGRAGNNTGSCKANTKCFHPNLCLSTSCGIGVYRDERVSGPTCLPGDIVFPVFHTSILSILVTATGLAGPLLFQVFQYEVIHLWWTDSWYTRLKSCMVFLTCIAKVLTVQLPMLFFWVQMWRFYRHISHVHPQVVYLLQ